MSVYFQQVSLLGKIASPIIIERDHSGASVSATFNLQVCQNKDGAPICHFFVVEVRSQEALRVLQKFCEGSIAFITGRVDTTTSRPNAVKVDAFFVRIFGQSGYKNGHSADDVESDLRNIVTELRINADQ